MAGGRQAVWLKAIESRVDATAQMLGTMKGVKMTGLTDKLQTMIQKQREEEITKSQKFRKLLIAMVGICKPWNFRHSEDNYLHHTSFCQSCHLSCNLLYHIQCPS